MTEDKLVEGEPKTINLILHREQEIGADIDEDEIDLVSIFVNMKAKLRIYIWLIIGCTLIGLLCGYIFLIIDKPKASVGTVITFEYLDVENQPAIRGLDLSMISSSFVVSGALDEIQLCGRDAKLISQQDVMSNISIYRILSRDTLQRLEIKQALIEDDKTNLEDILSEEYQYSNRIYITLRNGFGEKNESISTDSLKKILDSVVQSYKKYFFEQTVTFETPENYLVNIDVSSLDYAESMDLISEAMQSLGEYTDSVDAYRTIRSATSGINFEDLGSMIDSQMDICINPLVAYVTYSGATQDKSVLISRYEYQIRNLQYDMAALEENMAANAQLIANYRLESNTLTGSDGNVMEMGTSVTDYYNSLVLKQSSFYEKKSYYEKRILELQDRISAIQGSTNTVDQEIRQEIQEVYDSCCQIYEMADGLAREILSSHSAYADYVTSIDAQLVEEGASFSEQMKRMMLPVAAGFFVAIFIWGIDGLLTERRYGEIRISTKKKKAAGVTREASESL